MAQKREARSKRTKVMLPVSSSCISHVTSVLGKTDSTCKLPGTEKAETV